MEKIDACRLRLMVASVIIVSLVSGCGWIMGENSYIRDRSGDYRKAQVIEPLKVPEGADTAAIQELYPLPGSQRSPQFKGAFETPMPDSVVGSNRRDIRAFKAGARYWITMSSAPAEVWARVRRFWEINSIQLESEGAYEGLMETVWLLREAGGKETRDKFRIRVEHGMHRDSSEIYLMHLGLPADGSEPLDSDNLNWNDVKEDDQLAIAMMQEIAAFLIDTEYEGAPASLLAQSFSGSPKSSFGVDEYGNTVLLLNLDFERAWDAVGKALENAKILVDDMNRSVATYYVNYFSNLQKEEEKAGFLSFLKFGKDKPGKKLRHMTVTLTEISGKIAVKVQSDDKPKDRSLPESLLAEIKKNLI